MVSVKTTQIFRDDARLRGTKLTPAEREELMKPYLPDPNTLTPTPSLPRRKKTGKKQKRTTPIRTFLKSQLHLLIYSLIHLCFGFYVRISQTLLAVTDRVLAIVYHHHRTPELIQKDVKGLSRLPEHLSVLLKLRKEEDALRTLMDEVSEVAAWSSCAGIPVLSVYEKTGKLLATELIVVIANGTRHSEIMHTHPTPSSHRQTVLILRIPFASA
jgi:dehydrodolichyl diphosphate syntase complex subunit NUS1